MHFYMQRGRWHGFAIRNHAAYAPVSKPLCARFEQQFKCAISSRITKLPEESQPTRTQRAREHFECPQRRVATQF